MGRSAARVERRVGCKGRAASHVGTISGAVGEALFFVHVKIYADLVATVEICGGSSTPQA